MDYRGFTTYATEVAFSMVTLLCFAPSALSLRAGMDSTACWKLFCYRELNPDLPARSQLRAAELSCLTTTNWDCSNSNHTSYDLDHRGTNLGVWRWTISLIDLTIFLCDNLSVHLLNENVFPSLYAYLC